MKIPSPTASSTTPMLATSSGSTLAKRIRELKQGIQKNKVIWHLNHPMLTPAVLNFVGSALWILTKTQLAWCLPKHYILPTGTPRSQQKRQEALVPSSRLQKVVEGSLHARSSK